MDWWLELDQNAAFARFLALVRDAQEKRKRTLMLARGPSGAYMTNDEYHGTAGEARGLEYVLRIVENAKKEPASE